MGRASAYGRGPGYGDPPTGRDSTRIRIHPPQSHPNKGPGGHGQYTTPHRSDHFPLSVLQLGCIPKLEPRSIITLGNISDRIWYIDLTTLPSPREDHGCFVDILEAWLTD